MNELLNTKAVLGNLFSLREQLAAGTFNVGPRSWQRMEVNEWGNAAVFVILPGFITELEYEVDERGAFLRYKATEAETLRIGEAMDTIRTHATHIRDKEKEILGERGSYVDWVAYIAAQ